MSRRRTRGMSVAAVLRLLEEGEPEEVCAATIVLGALRPDDRRVVPALGRALDRVESPLVPYVIDALGRLEDERALRHLLRFVAVTGALREQVIRILSGTDLPVLPHLLRLRDRIPADARQSLVRIALARAEPADLGFAVSLLEGASFATARSFVATVRHEAPSWRSGLRGRLAAVLSDALLSERLRDDPTGTTAAFKALGVLRHPRGIGALLEGAASPGHPRLRRHALDALAAVPVPARRTAAVARRLQPLLAPGEDPVVVAGTLRVLHGLDQPLLDSDTILRLAGSEDAEVARLAVAEFRRFPRDVSLGPLLEALGRESDEVRDAAAGTLAELPGATEDLVAAHEDARFQDRRAAIRDVLAARADGVTPHTFRRLMRRLLDAGETPELRGHVLLLGAVDRLALNRALESRARRALRAARPADAVRLLEPVVGNRLATPQGRYLLAIAHLQLAGPDGPPDQHHHRRAMNLLGPLARLAGWSLRRHLLRERRLTPALAALVVRHMRRRPEPERSLAAEVASAFGLDGPPVAEGA